MLNDSTLGSCYPSQLWEPLLSVLYHPSGRWKNVSLEMLPGPKENTFKDFPGGPVVKTLSFQCRGAWVQSLVRNLRSHTPYIMAPKKKRTLAYCRQLWWSPLTHHKSSLPKYTHTHTYTKFLSSSAVPYSSVWGDRQQQLDIWREHLI